ncbi:MAG: diaminopimelate decarboxylase [SAR324 cluster bacterium]|nr:diaminopimelate decarboxylase [SAR324 cluster bacterium]MBF0352479.1 diaminopimelate decarboxylase [SAR324 cluster bacterium]
METVNNQILFEGISARELIQQYGSPLYVYEESVIKTQIEQLKKNFPNLQPGIHYAMKANPNPAILKLVLEAGCGVDTVSPLEVQLALDTGFSPQKIIFTGNNVTPEELFWCVNQGVLVNLDSLDRVADFGAKFPGTVISVRVNPGIGAGHHDHCITGGPKSKFGIYHDQMPQLMELLTRFHLKLTGIHSHIGTGILEPQPMMDAMDLILQVAETLPDLEFVDVGGGFGIPYQPGQQTLDIQQLGAKMSRRFQQFCEHRGKTLELKIEPGRYIIASSGTLLTCVNTIKNTPEYRFVGVDSGFNHLIRPMLYGSYHRIENASAVNNPLVKTVVVGNICETGDIFTSGAQGQIAREIPECKSGDILALRDAGAYGISMSSQYNMRPRPAEVMICSGTSRLIRRRETYEDLIRTFV